MIPAGIELLRHVFEDRFVVMLNLGRLAMNEPRRTHDPSAEHLTNRLMTQAHAENRKFAGEMANDFHRHTRVIGSTRSRRNHNSIWPHRRFNLVNGSLIVAAHLASFAHLAKILHDVVSESI